MKVKDDIRKFLIRNSIVTYASAAIAIAAMVLYFLNVENNRKESREYVYVLAANGEVIPTQLADRRENLKIELEHHLSMMVDNFYSLNKDNWERKVINGAFNLAELEQIHKDRANKGYYNRLIQFNTIQTAELTPSNIEIKYVGNDNFEFKIIINLLEEYADKKIKWLVFARGKAKTTDRHFPNNPHGFMVYGYIEDRIEKIEDQK